MSSLHDNSLFLRRNPWMWVIVQFYAWRTGPCRTLRLKMSCGDYCQVFWLCVCVCVTGDVSQGLVNARQVPYHWPTPQVLGSFYPIPWPFLKHWSVFIIIGSKLHSKSDTCSSLHHSCQECRSNGGQVTGASAWTRHCHQMVSRATITASLTATCPQFLKNKSLWAGKFLKW